MKHRNIVLITVMVLFLICMTLAGCTSMKSSENEPDSNSSEAAQETVSAADEKNAVNITLSSTSAEISGTGAAKDEPLFPSADGMASDWTAAVRMDAVPGGRSRNPRGTVSG